jgi:hypothetical protein
MLTAHLGGLPIEEALLTLVGGTGAALLLNARAVWRPVRRLRERGHRRRTTREASRQEAFAGHGGRAYERGEASVRDAAENTCPPSRT